MSRAEVAVARELLRRRAANAWLSSHGRPVAPDLAPSVRRQFREAFELLDSDGSGTLSEAEVYEGFRALSLPTSRAAVRHLVAEMKKRDHSGDGVTYAGFERMMAARREELPKSGSAAAPVSLEVMARSLRRAKLLNAVLLEREAAIADYRSRAAAAAAAREAAELAATAEQAECDEPAPAVDDNWAPAPPPGLRDDGDEPQHQEAEEPPPAFAFRKQRRRSVLVRVGDLEKLVDF